MCVYDNCPYRCETKYAHRKRFAAMAKKKPYIKEDKILSTKVNWEVAKEYFKDHLCLQKLIGK